MDLSVSAWREYLTAHGKIQTQVALDRSAPPKSKGFDCDTAFAILFNRLSDALPSAVRLAMSCSGIKASPRKADAVAWRIWIILAANYSKLAKEHDAIGPFDSSSGDGKVEYPEGIKELAARISQKLPKTQESPVNEVHSPILPTPLPAQG